jgi:Tol biopolymer transport system component
VRIHRAVLLPVLVVLLSAASLVVLLTSACRSGKSKSGSGAGAGAAQVPVLTGDLIVTGESTLDLVSKGKRTVIAKAPSATAYYEYPVFSPDGKSIAYVLATTPTGQGQDWGNDIYTSNLDGSNAKIVFKHDKPGALIDALSWTPDGQSIVYAYSRALYDAQNHYTGSIYRVDRLSLNSAASTTLLNNAIQPSVSWDGKQIVYVDFPQNDFQAASLAIADFDGSNARKLLTDQKGFQGFFAPHLSPDGKKIVFAAVGGPLGLPAGSPTPSIRINPTDLLLGDLVLPSPALADGAPYQIWIANIDGTDLHTISNLREDLPYPLWAADGKSIIFLGAGGLYSANADGSNLKRIGPGIPHGEIAWYQGA